MSRRRKHDPTIPEHIDQASIPAGVYWDRSGRGRWYVFKPQIDGTGPQRATIAGPDARLSDLHTIIEQRADPAIGTLAALCKLFEESPACRELAPDTRYAYKASRKRICGQATKMPGVTFGALQVARLSKPVVQLLIDKIAEKHPQTAAQAAKFLRRLFTWGMNRGKCTHNPALGLERIKLNPARRMPSDATHAALLAYARAGAQRKAHTQGSVAPYLWVCMEIAYLCHLRGIELLRMRESQATADSLITTRAKGSATTRFRWTPRLRAAWEAAISERNVIWTRKKRPVPIRAEDRPLLTTESGGKLTRSGLDSAWQRLIAAALADKILTEEQRFSLHQLKRKGITDRPGSKAEKQTASGHHSVQQLNVYDMAAPLVDPAQSG